MAQENLRLHLKKSTHDLLTTLIEVEVETLGHLQRWRSRSKFKQAASESIAFSKKQIDFYTNLLKTKQNGIS